MINQYLKSGELNFMHSKNSINFHPVLELVQFTSPGIRYYGVSKIKQHGWINLLMNY
jgi:hypothetical protein